MHCSWASSQAGYGNSGALVETALLCEAFHALAPGPVGSRFQLGFHQAFHLIFVETLELLDRIERDLVRQRHLDDFVFIFHCLAPRVLPEGLPGCAGRRSQNDVMTATPVPRKWSMRVSRSAPSSRLNSRSITVLGATTPDLIILKMAG